MADGIEQRMTPDPFPKGLRFFLLGTVSNDVLMLVHAYDAPPASRHTQQGPAYDGVSSYTTKFPAQAYDEYS